MDELPTRNTGEDAVRVIGLVAVVVSQVWSLEPVIRWTSWAVPLFFVVGGYYWFSGETMRDDVRRWVLSIGRPYVFWWVVTCAFFVAWEMVWGAGRIPTKAIELAVWGGAGSLRPWTGFWIVAACFIAMLFVQVTMRVGWLWTLGFAYVGLVAAWVDPHTARIAPLAAVSALACTGFVLLGIGLREAQPRLRHPILGGLAAIALGGLGTCLPAARPIDVQVADFGTPGLSILVASLIGSGLLLVGSAAGPHIPPAVGRGISALARCNVAVLLSFGMVLFVLETPKHGRWYDFALALGLPMVIALTTLRSRWAPWIHGAQDFSYRGSSHKRFRGAMF
jgi:acyltransferase